MHFKKMMVEDFAAVLASKSPVPGGGGASAVSAAIAACLGAMVGSLTVGKKKYASVEEEMQQAKEEAIDLAVALLDLTDKEAEAFAPLAAAYSLPKNTEEERAFRDSLMEDLLVSAAEVPLEIMEKCCRVIELSALFAEKGSKMAVSDAGCSATLAGAALRSTSLNVFINTNSMKNRERADALSARAEAMLEKYLPIADRVFLGVRKQF